ncbi:MAG TPA: 30S ribosomal protein S1 [Oligoflexia bacterium]|nr:30S ribosomal protein S1 [Oligoflexia bacterium]HMP27101.1 30S ribosomal protein S1 [Oligoflexia bacterium]
MSNSAFGSYGEEFFASTSGEFAELFNSGIGSVKPGTIVKGRVVGINRDMVTVDIGFKSDGVVPREQFIDKDGKVLVQIGDIVEVFVLALENEQGQVMLSKERADQKRIWEKVEQALKDGSTITGTVQFKVKGGLQVDIGIPAFLPGSQVDIRPHKNLDKFIGETYDFKVLKITRDKGNIVLSRRAVLISERDQLRDETLKHLAEGVVLEGSVKNLAEYGAFIDLGGIDGLLHVTDISWSRVNHPADKLSIGQVVPVVVLKYDSEKGRVSLGMKQLTPDPWEGVGEKYTVGSKYNAVVTAVEGGKVYLQVAEGIDGVIPDTELTWGKKVRNPLKLVNIGDTIEVQLVGIDLGSRKLVMSLKALQPNPWTDLANRFPVGTKVSGTVASIANFGMFVTIENGIDGLVHLSDFFWTKRVKDSKELQEVYGYQKGNPVEAVIMKVDPQEETISLSIKDLTENPWPNITARYPVNAKVRGVIRSVTKSGVFVELEGAIEGFIHHPDLGLERGEDPEKKFIIGDELEAEVKEVDSEAKRINLSVKTILDKRRTQERASYLDQEDLSVNLGDLISDSLKNR